MKGIEDEWIDIKIMFPTDAAFVYVHLNEISLSHEIAEIY